jgi:hypothetical protein
MNQSSRRPRRSKSPAAEYVDPVCRQCGARALSHWKLCGLCWKAKFGTRQPYVAPPEAGEQIAFSNPEQVAA